MQTNEVFRAITRVLSDGKIYLCHYGADVSIEQAEADAEKRFAKREALIRERETK